jgi:hypothetical protein
MDFSLPWTPLSVSLAGMSQVLVDAIFSRARMVVMDTKLSCSICKSYVPSTILDQVTHVFWMWLLPLVARSLDATHIWNGVIV